MANNEAYNNNEEDEDVFIRAPLHYGFEGTESNQEDYRDSPVCTLPLES